MSSDQAKSFAAELFRTNGNCSPPCFWGIIPGKTTLGEADQFLSRFGGKGYIEKDSTGEIYHYDNSVTVKQGYLGMSIVLGIKKGIVETILIFMGEFYEPGVEPEDWAAYTLKGMLKLYGVPSRVVFSVDYPHEPPYDTDKVSYSYFVYFDTYNVAITYSGGVTDDAAQYKICPLRPDQEPDYLNLWLGTKWEKSAWVDLTQASTLSYEDFYELFTRDNLYNCIWLNASVFFEMKTRPPSATP